MKNRNSILTACAFIMMIMYMVAFHNMRARNKELTKTLNKLEQTLEKLNKDE